MCLVAFFCIGYFNSYSQLRPSQVDSIHGNKYLVSVNDGSASEIKLKTLKIGYLIEFIDNGDILIKINNNALSNNDKGQLIMGRMDSLIKFIKHGR